MARYPVVDGRKQCSRCGNWVAVEEFYRKEGINNKCKSCQLEYARAHYKKVRVTKWNREDGYNHDIINKKFGKLTVASFVNRSNNQTWLNCICACGGSIVTSRSNLVAGCVSSCGCAPPGRPSPECGTVTARVFRSYQRSSFERDIHFELSIDNFSSLIYADCFYCGEAPCKIMYYRGGKEHVLVNGVDRVDNSKGYSIENVVPCCARCNYMKHTISMSEFEARISKIYKHLSLGGLYL